MTASGQAPHQPAWQASGLSSRRTAPQQQATAARYVRQLLKCTPECIQCTSPGCKPAVGLCGVRHCLLMMFWLMFRVGVDQVPGLRAAIHAAVAPDRTESRSIVAFYKATMLCTFCFSSACPAGLPELIPCPAACPVACRLPGDRWCCRSAAHDAA